MALVKPSLVKDEKTPYTVGDCAQFAFALHELTGLPIVSVVCRHPLPESEWCGDEESDKFDFEHSHAAVYLGEGHYLDVNGINKFDPASEEFGWSGLIGGSSLPYLDVYDVKADPDLLLEFFSYYADGEPVEEIVNQAKLDAVRLVCVTLIEDW